MSIALIKELLTAFDMSGLSKMALKTADFDLLLEKGGAPVLLSAPVAGAPAAAPIATMPVVEEAAGTAVKSPIIGVFYPAPAPEAPPFVTVGQRVQKGQTLCIVEAMKVMNEIAAPCDGVVQEIRVSREDLVEYDQILMIIA